MSYGNETVPMTPASAMFIFRDPVTLPHPEQEKYPVMSSSIEG